MLKLKELAEKVFVVFSLIISTTAIIPVLLDSADSTGIPADPFSPIVFAGIYAVTIILTAVRWKSILYVAKKDLFIWLLMGVVLASALWTIAPDVTTRRSALLLGTTLFGAYMATRYSLREQLNLLAWALGIIIVLSFMFAVALPFYGIMSIQENGAHMGSWRGVMTHKNLLGRLMVLSSIVFLLVASGNLLSSRRYRWIPCLGCILSVVLILLSTSKTALVVFITMMLIWFLYQALRQKFTILIPLLILLVLVGGGTATLFLDNLTFVAKALGRDLTLTGRTEIWSVMLDFIWQRPFFGYGFNAFWQGWNTEISANVWRILGWECPYGHNGFMDLLAELGFVGLGIFCISYVRAYVQGVIWVRMTTSVEGLWPLLYLTFLLMYNITEGTLLAMNSIFWILYVSTTLSMFVEYNQARRIIRAHSNADRELWVEMEA